MSPARAPQEFLLKKTVTAILIAASATLASADGLKSLESFMKGAQTGKADFTQTVTSPPKDGQTARTKTSSGSFEFQRPGRFKFVYKKPFEQTIVADGQTLWLYDVDLNQVTARKQQDALGSTPAALIASGTDIKGLFEAFDLKAGAARDGMEWVDAQPKAKDGQLQSVKVGFRQGQLAVLEIVDGLGQRSVLSFAQWQGNVAVKPERFRFQPPAGADVIRP